MNFILWKRNYRQVVEVIKYPLIQPFLHNKVLEFIANNKLIEL